MLTVMLNRQNTQTLATQRDLDRYVTHHMGKGFEETINNWIKTLGNRPISEALDASGAAFTLEPDSGGAVVVSFADAQGAALMDLTGLPSGSRDHALDILSRLRVSPGARSRTGEPLTRKYGPVSISVNSASEIVLHAAVGAVLRNGAVADSVVSDILRERGAEGMKPEVLEEIITRAGAEQAQTDALREVLTAAPMLWKFVVRPVAAPTDPNAEPVRFEGYAMVTPPGRNRASGGVQRTRSSGRASSRVASAIVGMERIRGEAAWGRGFAGAGR
jgi:hypothetical protein